MSRVRVPGDGPKCACGKPAVWNGFCQMADGRGYCDVGIHPCQDSASMPTLIAKWRTEKDRLGDLIVQAEQMNTDQIQRVQLKARWNKLNECIKELESCIGHVFARIH